MSVQRGAYNIPHDNCWVTRTNALITTLVQQYIDNVKYYRAEKQSIFNQIPQLTIFKIIIFLYRTVYHITYNLKST